MPRSIPMFGFSAYSGTGKTTLLTQLIPLLKKKNLNIAVVKHSHHHFDLDVPGKDSYELRKSGADQTIICSTTRMAVINEFKDPAEEPRLTEILDSIDAYKIDLVLVEGYKQLRFPKIELHRSELNKPYLFLQDPSIEAIACDKKPDVDHPTMLDINDIESIAEFVYQRFFSTRAE